MKAVVLIVVILSMALTHAAAMEKEEKPLWEVGVFTAAFQTPEYPSSDQKQSNVIGAPLFVYRGDVFRIGDGSAARAVAVDKDWIELDLSLDAAFNADSEDNVARQGMPDLDYLFELGPQVKMRLAQPDFGRRGKGKLSFDIQARAAFSTDLSGFNQRGYVFHPKLNYQHKGLFGPDSQVTVSIASTWATEKLHDYFYQVDPQFATTNRAEFDAKSGYLGTEVNLAVSHMIGDDIRVFVFGQVSIHSGAQNTQSPLFIDKTTYAVGLGFSWRLYQSDETVFR